MLQGPQPPPIRSILTPSLNEVAAFPNDVMELNLQPGDIAAPVEVEGVTPHTFRHTVATQLVRDPEVDLLTAATFLGHSRLDTTVRYSQPDAEGLEGAAKRLE